MITFNEIKETSKILENSNYDHMEINEVTHKIETVRTAFLENKYTLLNKMENAKGNPFTITTDEKEYLKSIIPCICNDYIHYYGDFFKIDYENNQIIPIESIDEGCIAFDYNTRLFDNLMISVRAASDILSSALTNYTQNCTYQNGKYTIIKQDYKSNIHPSYSFSKDEINKMDEWESKHNKKFHKKGFGYQGVSPVSNFEVRIGSCSIGMWADCVCTKCKKEVELLKSSGNIKKAEKLDKDSSYTLREID